MTCDFCEKTATSKFSSAEGEIFAVCDFCESDMIISDLKQRFLELQQEIKEKNATHACPELEKIIEIHV